MDRTEVKEVERIDFTICLSFDDYSKLARIRNARYESDAEALASVIERGLIELNGEIGSSKDNH